MIVIAHILRLYLAALVHGMKKALFLSARKAGECCCDLTDPFFDDTDVSQCRKKAWRN
jgi:hypothetical protein